MGWSGQQLLGALFNEATDCSRCIAAIDFISSKKIARSNPGYFFHQLCQKFFTNLAKFSTMVAFDRSDKCHDS